MYSLASQEILSKISKIFPGAVFYDVHSSPDSFSVSDFIERVVQRLPVPAELETSSAILNMKDVVDGQQLKIQLGMMDQEHPDIKEQFFSNESSSVESSSSSNCNSNNERYFQEHIWNPDEDCHIMAQKYMSFLV